MTATLPRRVRAALLLVLGLLALAAWVVWHNHQDDPDDLSSPPPVASAERIAHGAYLARAGNCADCHTRRGGPAYGGGRAIATPFGTVYAGNLTPDVSGLGAWSALDFRRALHQGRSRDGRLLIPAFPYTHFTQVSRDDVDALYLYLRSLPPVAAPATPHALRFPYNTQAALAVWRALYFRPGRHQPQPEQDAAWNRGAYLVNGLGHCAACHASRNLLGASASLAEAGRGAPLPQQRWVAPSFTDPTGASLAGWPVADAVALLRDGQSPRGVAQGPMAEVVAQSTQHLRDDDLRAIVRYLQSLPQQPLPSRQAHARPAEAMAQGGQLYRQHCASCHGDQGQGAPGIYPALAGNRLLAMPDPANLLQAITRGGFAPATAANPRPYGMPPFDLDDRDLAALLTWLRASWGHDAAPVTEVEVLLGR